MLDRKVVVRHLEHLRSQIDSLLAEVSKRDDEYSPLMSWESFHDQFKMACDDLGLDPKYSCICSQLGAGKHRCSQREQIVETYMSQQRNAAV